MKDGSDDSGPIIKRDIKEGKRLNSLIGYQFSYDTRRTGLDPTAGYLLEFGQEFAGLGGDNTFILSTARVAGERRVFRDDVLLRASVEGGALNYQSGVNRAVDRFILNSTNIRGFEPGGIGPRDLSEGDEDPLGGNFFVAARFEAQFPLGLPEEYGIKGGLFYDVGNLWNLDDVDLSGGDVVGKNGSFRHVIGVSLLWTTPLGPLRFNLSEAIKKESFDRTQNFEVTISTTF
jgi:outer membrane protein insertion porin family